jgi:hypothetical protein
MATPLRHNSLGDCDAACTEIDVQLKTNPYEVQRERQKKALHDSVQLTLLRSGFPEVASLLDAFIREGRAPSSMASTSRPRRQKVASVVLQVPCCNTRNLAKEAPTSTPTPATCPKHNKVRRKEDTPLRRTLSLQS